MVLVGGEDHPRPVREFMASVLILHHSTTISTGTPHTHTRWRESERKRERAEEEGFAHVTSCHEMRNAVASSARDDD
jgi:GTPase